MKFFCIEAELNLHVELFFYEMLCYVLEMFKAV
jgi:hypothetical protein